ncbi:hypothetical protein FB451DRAFT_1222276 [Mycena latifolia]|nr:hypothetical protein FB451DRAFT_1222276 [Mycena latifolia]
MPLAKSSSKPDKLEATLRLVRTLRRPESDVNPPSQTTAGPSNLSGRTSSSRRLRRVDNARNASETTASSSHTPSAPFEEDPRLAALLATLSPGPGNDVLPTIQVDPPSDPPPTESTFLAQKIRGLINSLPALSSRFLSPREAPAAAVSDGFPVPPPGAVRIQDPDLISLLSDPGVMSGSDGRRQSVWSMLDAITPPSPRNTESGNDETDYDYAGSDRSSVMMYSPLIPTAGSVIELAELEDAPISEAGPSSGKWLPMLWPASGWASVWPFTGWKKPSVVAEEPEDSTPSPIQVPVLEPRPNGVAARRDVPVLRVWVPSTTQLSFETMWWGYRIYLPPPVLAILDDQSVEAARQATTLTAALTWFFSNLPVASFPPPLQPAMILLQRLVPFVSYIGTFISWSWSTIRGFDRGHGVILTATWLLPIALIPGTWHARDVPPPSHPASPVLTPIPTTSLLFELSPEPPAPVLLYTEPEPPLPPAPMLPPVPLPPDDDPPAPLPPHDMPTPPPPRRSTLGRSKKKTISTLRKLTRTLT